MIDSEKNEKRSRLTFRFVGGDASTDATTNAIKIATDAHIKIVLLEIMILL